MTQITLNVPILSSSFASAYSNTDASDQAMKKNQCQPSKLLDSEASQVCAAKCKSINSLMQPKKRFEIVIQLAQTAKR